MSSSDQPIEDYLDRLLARLHGYPRSVRRALGEAEAHLHETATAAAAKGLDPVAAERRAVERFGPVEVVAAAFNQEFPRVPVAMLLPRLAGQLAPLAGVGLVAVGLSGLVARLMLAVWGRTFVFADPAGTRYASSACQHWQRLHPGASDCAQAFLAEATADGLQARFACGVLGVAVLVACYLLRRRRGGRFGGYLTAPLPAFGGASAYLVAGAVLLGLGVDRMRGADGHGAGQWLSAGIVAVAFAAVYAAAFLRRATRQPVLR